MVDIVIALMPQTQLKNPTMYYPLGALYLSAIYKAKGMTVRVADFRAGMHSDWIEPCKHLMFSCTTPEITAAKKLAAKYRGCCHTVVGGAHPTLATWDCIGHFDTIALGELENMYESVLQHHGVVGAPRVKNLDDTPFPDWNLISNPFSESLMPGEKYGKGAQAATLIASRGCPMSCSFCGNMYHNPVVYRSANNIVQEILVLIEQHGVKQYRFEDDNLTIHPQLPLLCSELAKLKRVFGIEFKGHSRADLIKDDKIAMLKSAGLVEMGFGVEAADDAVLKLNNKKETVDDFYQAARILKKHGVRVKTYFVANLPGETDATIDSNIKFLHEAKPDKWTIGRFMPYPGTDIYKCPEKYGLTIHNHSWEDWWNFPDKLPYTVAGATNGALDARYHRLYAEFSKCL